MRLLTVSLAALALTAGGALAQDDATLSVAQSDEYGSYLVGPDGRPVYLFTTDTQGDDSGDPAVSCEGDCLGAWPLVTAPDQPDAGEKVDEEMIGSLMHDGESVLSYNGWPLYYFASDTAGQPPQGQEIESFGGEWYLIGPEGQKVEGEM